MRSKLCPPRVAFAVAWMLLPLRPGGRSRCKHVERSELRLTPAVLHPLPDVQRCRFGSNSGCRRSKTYHAAISAAGKCEGAGAASGWAQAQGRMQKDTRKGPYTTRTIHSRLHVLKPHACVLWTLEGNIRANARMAFQDYPNTQCLRPLVPNTIPETAVETRSLKW